MSVHPFALVGRPAKRLRPSPPAKSIRRSPSTATLSPPIRRMDPLRVTVLRRTLPLWFRFRPAVTHTA